MADRADLRISSPIGAATDTSSTELSSPVTGELASTQVPLDLLRQQLAPSQPQLVADSSSGSNPSLQPPVTPAIRSQVQSFSSALEQREKLADTPLPDSSGAAVQQRSAQYQASTAQIVEQLEALRSQGDSRAYNEALRQLAGYDWKFHEGRAAFLGNIRLAESILEQIMQNPTGSPEERELLRALAQRLYVTEGVGTEEQMNNKAFTEALELLLSGKDLTPEQRSLVLRELTETLAVRQETAPSHFYHLPIESSDTSARGGDPRDSQQAQIPLHTEQTEESSQFDVLLTSSSALPDQSEDQRLAVLPRRTLEETILQSQAALSPFSDREENGSEDSIYFLSDNNPVMQVRNALSTASLEELAEVGPIQTQFIADLPGSFQEVPGLTQLQLIREGNQREEQQLQERLAVQQNLPAHLSRQA